MRKNTRYTFTFACLLIVIIGCSVFFSYNLFNRNSDSKKQNKENNINRSYVLEKNAFDFRKNDTEQDIKEKKIKHTTKMVYEYHYTEDDSVVRNYEMAPYFLIDLTEAELTDRFIDWDVLSFTNDEIVMRKYIEGRSEKHYVLGIKDGYVSVFYDNMINGSNLKEITNTLVSALPEEEQERLHNGILIYGDENLMRALEDYGS